MTTQKPRTAHMQATIPFVIEAVRDRERRGLPQDYVTRQDGSPVTYAEAIEHLEAMRRDGFELVPCSCADTDERGRCPGWTR